MRKLENYNDKNDKNDKKCCRGVYIKIPDNTFLFAFAISFVFECIFIKICSPVENRGEVKKMKSCDTYLIVALWGNPHTTTLNFKHNFKHNLNDKKCQKKACI